MKNEYEVAMMRMNENSQAQRQRDHGLAEELAQQLHCLRSETATSFVQLVEKAQGDDMVMAREYEKLTAELHKQARENLHLRAGMATTEHALTSVRSRLQIVQNEEVMAVNEARQTAQVASDNMANVINDAQGAHLAIQRENTVFANVWEKRKSSVLWQCKGYKKQKVKFGITKIPPGKVCPPCTRS